MQRIGLIVGLIVFALFLMTPPPEGLSLQGWRVLGIGCLMAIWWLTETVPISVTAMVPLVAFPFLDIAEIKEIGKSYAGKAVFLTLGGFLIGVALQRWHLHERLALHTIRLVGTNPRRVVGGFMLASASLSMWITNTGTTVMMLPIAMSVAHLLMQQHDDEKETHRFAVGLMLALAYAATLGGMSSLVGTSTNVIFKGYMEEQFGVIIDFNDWLMIGLPVSITMLLVTWWLITHVLYPFKLENNSHISDLIHSRLQELGPVTQAEKLTMLVFAITVSLWVGKDIIEPLIPGIHLNDASIAMFGGMLLFVLPSGTGKAGRLLRWEDTKDVSWGILILLGGGLSLAGMMNQSGLAHWLGGQFSGLDNLSIVLLILMVTASIILLSEVMSNVATLSAFLPVIALIAISFGENPLMMAVPAALAASCAFMLPIGTPPNAIVFSSGYITVKQMARTGAILNIIALIIINVIAYFMLQFVFGVQAGVMPEWAAQALPQ